LGYPQDSSRIREGIYTGELKWITILLQNTNEDTPTVEDLAAWHERFPNTNIDVVLVNDIEGDHWDFFDANWQIFGFPTIDLITPEFTWYNFAIFGHPESVAAYVDEYL
jgi:hypothetical protein